MKSCPKCLNLLDDTAVACAQCGTVLDQTVIARAGGRNRPETLLELPDTPRPTPPSVPPPASSNFRPSPPPPLSPPVAPTPGGMAGRRGSTLYVPPSATAQPGAAPASPRVNERKVLGVLVTYSWRPEGQVFPVREGRNLIGRGEECDIRMPDDPMLSQVNSHITFRQNFVLGDMVSMSGTDLDGEPVEEQFRPLGNYAKIRTGSTHWLFVIVDPALASR